MRPNQFGWWVCLLFILWGSSLAWGQAQRALKPVVEQPSFVAQDTPYRYRALLIGNDDYEHWGDLQSAVHDAQTLARVLQEYYQFTEGDIRLLTNATRNDMLGGLRWLQETSQPNDRVLLYYAGHGSVDEEDNTAYWVPVDGRRDQDFDWLHNERLLREFRKIDVRHKLLIADSCFSGNLLTRGFQNQPDSWDFEAAMLREKQRLKSVIGLSSGGNEPVVDGAPRWEGHSVFAYHLLAQLEANARPYLSATELGWRISKYVANDTQNLIGLKQQTPIVRPISNQGDQGGEFFFQRSDLISGPPANSLLSVILLPEDWQSESNELETLTGPLHAALRSRQLKPLDEPMTFQQRGGFSPAEQWRRSPAEYALVLYLSPEFRQELSLAWAGIAELKGRLELHRHRMGHWESIASQDMTNQKLPLRRWDSKQHPQQWRSLLEKYVRFGLEQDTQALLSNLPK
ncbi:MAG: caspase family protein [Deltaproteobacteria bacterium]